MGNVRDDETVCSRNECKKNLCCGENSCEFADGKIRIIASGEKTDARTDFEKMADAMEKTSAGIEEFKRSTVAAAHALKEVIESLDEDMKDLPEGMMKSWLSFYASGMDDVQKEYVKVMS